MISKDGLDAKGFKEPVSYYLEERIISKILKLNVKFQQMVMNFWSLNIRD